MNSDLKPLVGLPALTIWQPWATLLIFGRKPIENRKWRPKLSIGDRLVIHAGKDQADVDLWVLAALLSLGTKVAKTALVSGAILGTMVYRGLVTEAAQLPKGDRQWWVGPFGWKLDDPVPLKTPIPMKGALGLWRVKP